MAFKVGAIISKLTLDKSGWNQSIKAVDDDQKKMQGMSDETARKFKMVGAAMTVAGGLIVAALGSMVNKASEAEETYAKFGTIFNDVIGEAEKKARDLAESYGLSTLASKDMLAATGDLLTGLGTLPGVALELSEKTQQLAVDLASFTNFSGGAAGASAALTKAMLGERESIKSLGIVITEEMVKEELLAQGKDKLTGLAQKEAAAEATLAIAYRQSLNAIGDYERTSGSLANQKRLLKARLEDVAVTIGTKLIPIVTDMVTKIVDVVEKVTTWMDENPKLTETIVKMAAGIGGLLLVLGPIVMLVPKLVIGAKMLAGAFTLLLSPVGLLVAALAALAIGYMKVKAAQKEAEKSSKTYAEQNAKLFTKLKESAEAAGMTAEEFDKLKESYDNNSAAMAMAIKRGDEGIEMQKALKEHTSDYEVEAQKATEAQEKLDNATLDLTGSFQGYLDGLKETKKETKTWVDYLKDVGVKTVKEKEDRVKELTGYLGGLKTAYDKGLLSLEDYINSTNAAKKEIEDLSTEITETTIPAARDMAGVFEQAVTDMEVTTEDFTIKTAEKVTEVENIWIDMYEGIKNTAKLALGDMLAGNITFKDAVGRVWDDMKQRFADIVADMVINFAIDGVKSLISGATAAASGIGSAMESVGAATAPLAAGIGTLITTLAKAIATAAEIIAASAPAILIAAGVALAIYAGFKLISSLFKKTAKPGSELDFLRQITENTFTIKDLMLGDYKAEIHTTQNILRDIWHTSERIWKRQDVIVNNLKVLGSIIKESFKSLPSAQHGAVVTGPTLAALHGTPSDPEIVSPVSKLVEGLKGFGGASASLSQNINVSIMVKDQLDPYVAEKITREQIVPNMLRAIDVDSRNKTRMRNILGIQV